MIVIGRYYQHVLPCNFFSSNVTETVTIQVRLCVTHLRSTYYYEIPGTKEKKKSILTNWYIQYKLYECSTGTNVSWQTAFRHIWVSDHDRPFVFWSAYAIGFHLMIFFRKWWMARLVWFSRSQKWSKYNYKLLILEVNQCF